MRVLVCEPNLLWSSRLVRTVHSVGHEPILHLPEDDTDLRRADAAIVNLSEPGVKELIHRLKANDVWVIGHAGHKEKQLLQLGESSGCDVVVSNSTLTFRLPKLIDPAFLQVVPESPEDLIQSGSDN